MCWRSEVKKWEHKRKKGYGMAKSEEWALKMDGERKKRERKTKPFKTEQRRGVSRNAENLFRHSVSHIQTTYNSVKRIMESHNHFASQKRQMTGRWIENYFFVTPTCLCYRHRGQLGINTLEILKLISGTVTETNSGSHIVKRGKRCISFNWL